MPVVLGRMIRLSLPFRFSEESKPEPAIQHERTGHVNVHQEHPGHASVSQRLHATGQDQYGRESGALPVAENLARHAIADGSYRVHRFDPEHQEDAGAHHAYLVVDPSGRVTAHAGPEHDDRHGFVGNPFPRRIRSGHQYGPNDLRTEVHDDEPQGQETNVARKHFRDAHEKAVREGKVFVTTRHHPEMAPFLRAISDAEKNTDWGTKPIDHAPSLIFADWLNEHGHDDVASAIRGAPEFSRRHGGEGQLQTVHNVLEYLAHPERAKADAEFYRMNGVNLSLRFAGLEGQAPRRQGYSPKPRSSDLKEMQWGKIKHYFPSPDMGPRNRKTPIRVMMNMVMFRLENQIPLRHLAEAAPDGVPWGSLHAFESRVAEAGLWPTILQEIGRDDLLPALEKMIPTAMRAQGGPSTKVNTAGLMTTPA